MIPTFNQMKDEALERLKSNWGEAILATLVIIAISAVISFIPFGGLIVGGPFALGSAIFFLRMTRGEQAEVKNVFDGFKENFGNSVGAYILMIIITLLGFLLLIIPGIIALLAMSQTFRIMKDNPGLGATEALQKSHEMMKGHRMEYFLLNLSFIGWALLCLLTFGIGFLVLAPYVSATNAVYYDYLSNQHSKEIDQLGSHLETNVK